MIVLVHLIIIQTSIDFCYFIKLCLYLRLEINEIPALFIRVAFLLQGLLLQFYTFLLAKANFNKSITNDVSQII